MRLYRVHFIINVIFRRYCRRVPIYFILSLTMQRPYPVFRVTCHVNRTATTAVDLYACTIVYIFSIVQIARIVAQTAKNISMQQIKLLITYPE